MATKSNKAMKVGYLGIYHLKRFRKIILIIPYRLLQVISLSREKILGFGPFSWYGINILNKNITMY
jgi:hypothetical protein